MNKKVKIARDRTGRVVASFEVPKKPAELQIEVEMEEGGKLDFEDLDVPEEHLKKPEAFHKKYQKSVARPRR